MAKRDGSNFAPSHCSKLRRSLLPAGSHLKLRGKRWTYRRAVPPELRSGLGCSEIVRSLHTGDIGRAEKLADALDVEVSRLFEIAARIASDGRGADGMGNSDDLLRGQELIEKLCDAYLRRLLDEDRASRQSGEKSGDVDGWTARRC